MDVTISILMLLLGSLLSALSTAALIIQRGSRKRLDEIAHDVRCMGDKLDTQAVMIARDYMTHDQHERYHGRHPIREHHG